MAIDPDVLTWLLAGDVSIQYQVHRDVLETERDDLRARIQHEGWGAQLLSCVSPGGHWGRGYYQPKWTSTHYTLLDLADLEMPAEAPAIQRAVDLVVPATIGRDGGIDPSVTIGRSDVCVTGMALRFLSVFGVAEQRLTSLVDFLLGQQLADGGFNCQSNRSGASTGSVHSTISVMEGFAAGAAAGHEYRAEKRQRAHDAAAESLLCRHLYQSQRTGAPIRPEFTRLHHPARWHFDVLRALDHWRAADLPYDDRMADALRVVADRRRDDGRWSRAAAYPGQVHFAMEEARQPSRWITLKVLRVLDRYGL